MDEFKKSIETSKIFQLLQKGKDDLLKGLSKDVVQSLLLGSLDKLFELLSQHELEIVLRIKKREQNQHSENQEGAPPKKSSLMGGRLHKPFHSSTKKNSP